MSAAPCIFLYKRHLILISSFCKLARVAPYTVLGTLLSISWKTCHGNIAQIVFEYTSGSR